MHGDPIVLGLHCRQLGRWGTVCCIMNETLVVHVGIKVSPVGRRQFCTGLLHLPVCCQQKPWLLLFQSQGRLYSRHAER